MVCLDQFKYQDTIKMLMCLHIFHPKCIMEWFANKAECPICKFDIESKKDILLTLKNGQAISYNSLLNKDYKLNTTSSNNDTNSTLASIIKGNHKINESHHVQPAIRRKATHEESNAVIQLNVSASQCNISNISDSLVK